MFFCNHNITVSRDESLIGVTPYTEGWKGWYDDVVLLPTSDLLRQHVPQLRQAADEGVNNQQESCSSEDDAHPQSRVILPIQYGVDVAGVIPDGKRYINFK